jgi:hypothetical protein
MALVNSPERSQELRNWEEKEKRKTMLVSDYLMFNYINVLSHER